MDLFLNILVVALVGILCLIQGALAIHQIRKKATDGPILLTISIAVFVIWVPLCIFRFLYEDLLGIKIAWYAVAVAYMVFALWYTNSLSKQFKK